MKVILLSILTIFTLSSGMAYANSNDPCAVVICMTGKALGQSGGGDCNKPIKKFFSITKKKKGKFNRGRTYDARKGFLNSCPTADPKDISRIMSKYGTVRL